MHRLLILIAVALVAAACGEAPEALPAATADPDEAPVDDAAVEPAAIEPVEDTDDAGAEVEPAAVAGGDFCDDITTVFALFDDFEVLLFSDALASEPLVALMDELAQALTAATGSAPDNIADDVRVMADVSRALFEELARVDPSDEEAFAEALFGFSGEEGEDAYDRVEAYAQTECGAASDLPEPEDLPDPCTFVPPEVIAAGLSVDGDLTATEGTTTFAFPGLTGRTCTYRGELDGHRVTVQVSTLGFRSVEEVRSFHTRLAEILLDDVDLGDLPSSTLLWEAYHDDDWQQRSIAVFEAPVPFTLEAFPVLVDPARLVAGAEAMLAHLR